MKSAIVASLLGAAAAKVYMKETFDGDWEKRWTVGSEWKPSHEMGTWKHTGGQFTGAEGDKGIQTGPDARFHSITAPLSEAFNNKDKDLVISYTVKHEQDLDCGGAYIKLLPGGFDAKKFGGDTPYAIMFGPDVCGYSTRKTHVILTRDGKNHLTKKNIKCETDRLSHRYTLVLHPDNSYEVHIDGAKVESGDLLADWDLLPPKTIKDPEAKKPEDWDERATIPDESDVKPAGWDDIPEKIVDPAAKKPEDWDEEEDGEWTAPMIPNPEYKGAWVQKQKPNPAYKGIWVAPDIANPAFKAEEAASAYNVCAPCSAVGFELWQVKSGTIFDDIMVADSLAEAEAFAKETFEAKRPVEKAAFDAAEAKKKEEQEAARKKAEEEAKAKEAEKKEDENDEEEEEEDKDEL